MNKSKYVPFSLNNENNLAFLCQQLLFTRIFEAEEKTFQLHNQSTLSL